MKSGEPMEMQNVRTQHWKQQVTTSRWSQCQILGKLVELSKRFTIGELWGAHAPIPGLRKLALPRCNGRS